MPAAGNPGSVTTDVSKEAGRTKTAADRANSEAAKLHDVFNKAKPKAPDNYVPSLGTPGGDIQLQPGLFTSALIGPGVWPTESESELAQTKTKLEQLRDRHQDAADEARRLTDEVYSQHWTDGAGADAAYEHYSAEYKAHLGVVDVLDGVAKTNGRLGEWIRLAKRNIRDAHDQAHREIEDYLKAPGGTPTAVIGSVIVPKYRTLIEGFSGQLKTAVGDETMSLSNEFGFPEAPPGSPGNQDKPDDRHTADPSEDPTTKPLDSQNGTAPTDGGYKNADVLDGAGKPDPATGLGTGLPDPLGTGYTNAPSVGTTGSTTKPSMPSIPSAPSMGGSGGGSGGGGSSPLSSLGGSGSGMGSMQGMGGAANGLSGTGSMSGPASGLQGSAAQATPASLGSEFGRGVAAGSAAAGGAPAFGGAQSAPPQPPAGPLSAAPLGQTSAAAAAAPVAASTPPSSAPPAAGMGGGMGGVPAGGLGSAGGGGGPAPQMTPYSSVLPQSPGGAAGAGPGPVGSGLGSAAPPPATGAGAGAGPGFLPGVREVSTPQRVGRDVSMTDLEAARAVVADLAAASSVVYPGLEWAVVVSRGHPGSPRCG